MEQTQEQMETTEHPQQRKRRQRSAVAGYGNEIQERELRELPWSPEEARSEWLDMQLMMLPVPNQMDASLSVALGREFKTSGKFSGVARRIVWAPRHHCFFIFTELQYSDVKQVRDEKWRYGLVALTQGGVSAEFEAHGSVPITEENSGPFPPPESYANGF